MKPIKTPFGYSAGTKLILVKNKIVRKKIKNYENQKNTKHAGS